MAVNTDDGRMLLPSTFACFTSHIRLGKSRLTTNHRSIDRDISLLRPCTHLGDFSFFLLLGQQSIPILLSYIIYQVPFMTMSHETKTPASASSLSARKLAATVVSDINNYDIPHVFIGGLPLNLLGHTRYGSDIDVLVDDTAFCGDDTRMMKPRLREIRMKHDQRFTTTNGALMHLHFRAPIGQDVVEVPVETLPAGQLGLPLRLEDV